MSRVILHAPTAGALVRARSNLRNLLRAEPSAEVRILANAAGAAAAVRERDPEADRFLFLCENSLRAQALVAPEGIATVPAVVQALIALQAEGWTYIRT